MTLHVQTELQGVRDALKAAHGADTLEGAFMAATGRQFEDEGGEE